MARDAPFPGLLIIANCETPRPRAGGCARTSTGTHLIAAAALAKRALRNALAFADRDRELAKDAAASVSIAMPPVHDVRIRLRASRRLRRAAADDRGVN
jgi:hypothetical protein